MTVTVHGTYLTGDDQTPAAGTVEFRPHLAAVHQGADPPHLVVQAPVRCVLDDTGSFTVQLIASDDPGWRTDGPVPYLVTVAVTGYAHQYEVLLVAASDPIDLVDLLPLPESPDVGVVPVPGPQGEQGPPGPKGDTGAQGPQGAPGTGVDGSGNLNAAGWIRAGVKPSTVNDVPRLARVPNAATGDLGLPGYMGSDTGWRDVTALAAAGAVTGGGIHVRRIGRHVFWRFQGAVLSQGSGLLLVISALPAGFYAASYVTANVCRADNLQAWQYLASTGTDLYWLYERDTSTGSTVRPDVGITGTFNYPTDDAWPASLPSTMLTPPAVWP